MKSPSATIGYYTDEELIQTAFFEMLIRRYNPLLYKLARTYDLNYHDAEDVIQET